MLREAAVAALVMVTAAPGTMDPCGSVTRPLIEAVPD
jgi:hypothetical protein